MLAFLGALRMHMQSDLDGGLSWPSRDNCECTDDLAAGN